MSIVTSKMPFDVYQVVQAQMYGFPAYPNAENIAPPLSKERKRVVEAATRTEVKLQRIKAVQDRIDEINALRQQAALRYNRDLSTVSPSETQGQFIDIEV